ncbi:alkaline phosphatase D family protein [Streptomyces fulvoviolaceus]|uniref:alkaline phosphatase D family protein n=1 Tax=Streptomyces fulvoviolaceus TaxID=285535 RepID=UPI0021C05EB9|nr:alkaline phosphatase D family protein [Streptomyces fulvoviolaceus]MCT9083483.1 alkaline phosphatase D family protein [Streptomyces fulvoviolaceus]
MALDARTSQHTPELRAAARHLSRRRFLTVSGAAAALAFAVNLPAAGTAAAAELDPAQITEDPFTLGVASGDPLPGSVLLWTRLAPAPYQPDGGLPAERVTVHWELARDENFSRVVRRGSASAHPEFGHSVHVQVDDLDEDRVYYYRFKAGSWISRTGRTRTAPGRGAKASALTLGVVSCQRYDQGYYTAYKHLAEDDVDVVFHLGDYLYEYAVSGVAGARAYPAGTVPDVYDHEMTTLDDYRLKYALYKSDPDLLAAHAAHPFVVTWDDHETENNYAGAVSENNDPEFLIRRAAAYRAYWENQPLRRPQLPDGADLKLYRRLYWGRLAQFDVLDTRQYRSDQAYGDGWKVPGPDSEDPARTLTGDAQEEWLIDGWQRSHALWNVVPQQVTFSQRHNSTAVPSQVSMDSWDGYPASRERILAGAEESGVENLMVLTGDVHVHYGFDIKRDFADRTSRTLGTEIVTSSISSGGNGSERPANWATFMAANPHLRFYNGLRGYATVTLGRDLARADFKTVPYVTTQGAPLTTAASFVTEVGEQGLKPA